MITKKVWFKVTWQGTILKESYYWISGKDKKEIRAIAKEWAKSECLPAPKAKLSIRTSFNGWVE